MYNWPLSIFVLKNTAELLNNVYTEKETELNFAINFFIFHTVIIFIFLLYSYWDEYESHPGKFNTPMFQILLMFKMLKLKQIQMKFDNKTRNTELNVHLNQQLTF